MNSSTKINQVRQARSRLSYALISRKKVTASIMINVPLLMVRRNLDLTIDLS